MKYMTGDSDVPGLGLTLLGDEDEMSGEEMYAQWKLYCAEYGLNTNSMTTASPMPLYGTAGKPEVALAIAYGRDANGREVLSDMAYVIYDGGDDIKTLHDFYPSYSGLSAPAPSSVVVPELPKRIGNLIPAAQMTAPATTRSEVKDVVKQNDAVRYIWRDMNSLGEHPHAVSR